jgi:hypothetical protein
VGHVHAYERTLPMYQGQANSQGMITIVNGNGGNNEGLATDWIQPQPKWYLRENSDEIIELTFVIDFKYLFLCSCLIYLLI